MNKGLSTSKQIAIDMLGMIWGTLGKSKINWMVKSFEKNNTRAKPSDF